jgi:ABC-type polysaccharide/polyol phosphate export permease
MEVFYSDFKSGFRMFGRAFLIANYENGAKFRRTVLGPYWAILAVSFGSIGIAILWGALFNMPWDTAIPTITTGFLVWYFVSGVISDGVMCFKSQSETILSVKLPLSFYPLLNVMVHATSFLQSLLIVLLINFVYPPVDVLNFLYFFPLFALTFLNIYCFVYLVGFLNTRFADIGVLVQSLMPLMFFFSPVVFKLDQLAPNYAWVLNLNPMTHMIICLRDPLIGIKPDSIHIIFQLSSVCVVLLLLACVFRANHKKFGFWL